MKIRFCENNKCKGKKNIVERLKEEYPDLNIKIKDCIKECSACCEKPVAKVGEVKITARDSDMLYKKVVEAINTKS